MMHPGKALMVCVIGLGTLAEAVPAFSMPAAPTVSAPADGDIVKAQWGPPPPGYGWGPPPPRHHHRPPPPDWGWGPPPPRHYHRPPPPPSWGWEPPRYYRPAPPPPPRYYRPRTNPHVQWCLDRYMSYNPSTNRYLSSSGYYKVCISPYSY